MGSQYETIVNSSNGTGLFVSMDKGRRSEEFVNSKNHWYYAAELVLEGPYHSFETSFPGLGDLSVFQVNWDDDDDFVLVARFPKGSWEYARLMISKNSGGRTSAESHVQDSDDRNICPQGCYVQGWADLSAETKSAHMEYNHSGKRRR